MAYFVGANTNNAYSQSIALITACMALLHAFFVIIHPAERLALHHLITIGFSDVFIQTWKTFRHGCFL